MHYINGEGIGFMAAKKDYAAMCSAIVSACGGEQNIANVAHCMTRLRLQLKDASTFDENAAKAVSGVIGLVVQNGEYQFVIGQDVPSLYEEFLKIEGIAAGGSVGDPQTAKVDHKDHGSVVNAILSFLGGTFSPVIPVIVAGGLTGAVLTLLVNFCGVSSDSGTYQFFSCINQATFYFLPVFIGFSAAQRLKSNGYLGAFLGAVLLFYTIGQGNDTVYDFFGLAVPAVSYNSTVFPVILGVLLMSVAYRWFQRVLPEVLRTVFVPLLTMLVTVPVTLLVLGPIGYTAGTVLADVLINVYRVCPAVAVAFVGCFTPFLVFFGMNNALYPLQFILMAEVGSDPLICAGMTAANLGRRCVPCRCGRRDQGGGALRRGGRRRHGHVLYYRAGFVRRAVHQALPARGRHDRWLHWRHYRRHHRHDAIRHHGVQLHCFPGVYRYGRLAHESCACTHGHGCVSCLRLCVDVCAR